MRLAVIESPFAGDVETNLKYARAAMADSLSRGEAPIASHLLYTQPGILDDAKPGERELGIEAGLAWGRLAEITAVYADRGITPGMQQGIDRALREDRAVEVRLLPCWANTGSLTDTPHGRTMESNPEPIPRDILTTLFRGLVHCGDQISDDQREQAWAWLEERNPYEEMGQ
jgi:hypothetical protein